GHLKAPVDHDARPQEPMPEVQPAPELPPEPAWLAQLDSFGIPRMLNYPATTLARMLDQTADRFGQCMALVYNHTKRWTYRDLQQQVNRLAGGRAHRGV